MESFVQPKVEYTAIRDFTNVLPEGVDTYIFNPSVARWKDDLYLCAYRIFTRHKQTSKRDIVHPKFDPNHPWKSDQWWRGGTDGTKFALLKISSKTGFQLESDLTANTFSIDDNRLINLFSRVDARLLHVENNIFVLSYNAGSPRGMSLNACVITLDENTKRLTLHPDSVVCPRISNPVEKNWSFWLRTPAGTPRLAKEPELFFSYGISPKHTVYKALVRDSKIVCDESPPLAEKIGYFGLLEKCYNLSLPKNERFVFISVTTPALQRKGIANRYLAVGHLKVRWKHLKKLPPTSALAVFYKEYLPSHESALGFYSRHAEYDYFMFIYEFDGITMEVTRITNFFVVSGEPRFILSFPSGIEYYADTTNVMIFFGDHDSASKMIIMTNENLEANLSAPVFDKNKDSYLYEPEINACSLLPGPGFVLINQK